MKGRGGEILYPSEFTLYSHFHHVHTNTPSMSFKSTAWNMVTSGERNLQSGSNEQKLWRKHDGNVCLFNVLISEASVDV